MHPGLTARTHRWPILAPFAGLPSYALQAIPVWTVRLLLVRILRRSRRHSESTADALVDICRLVSTADALVDICRPVSTADALDDIRRPVTTADALVDTRGLRLTLA